MATGWGNFANEHCVGATLLFGEANAVLGWNDFAIGRDEHCVGATLLLGEMNIVLGT